MEGQWSNFFKWVTVLVAFIVMAEIESLHIELSNEPSCMSIGKTELEL